MTKDGKVYSFWESSGVINSTEITDTQDKNEIIDELENDIIYYDANNENCAQEHRSLLTYYSTTSYSCEISFVKEENTWYYNTSIDYGGVE